MPREKYTCPICNTVIFFNKLGTLRRICSCGFSGFKKDFDVFIEKEEKSPEFWPKKKAQVRERITGFDKKNLFDKEGKIIDPRK